MRRLLALAPIVVLATVLLVVPLPYFAVSPGPAHDVEPLIRIADRRVYASEGHFLLTTVERDRVTLLEAVGGWLDERVDVVPERDLIPRGLTESQESEIQLSQMDSSKLAAASVALQRVTDYPVEHGPGAIIQGVVQDAPAEGILFAGDLVVRARGRPVADDDALGEAIRDTPAGRELVLVVRAAGQERTVRVRPAPTAGSAQPMIGVFVIDNFPFPLTIESGAIGGPSAGLMWALGITDLLTPGDLTGGRSIAGTGTIDLDGSVGPIGGIEQKILAADAAGVDLFLVPRDDLPGARAAGTSLELVPVDTYEEALGYLVSTCGGCELP